MNWREASDLAISCLCLLGMFAVMFGWTPSEHTVAFVAFSGCSRAWWVSAEVRSAAK
jgi:hypothetical protein